MPEKADCSHHNMLFIICGCGGGEWPPLLALAERSHHNGHNVLVVCDNSTRNSVEAAQLKALCLPPSLEFARVFDPAMERLFAGQVSFEITEENPFTVWGKTCIDYIIEALQNWRPDIIVISLFGLGLGALLAKRFSVPRCFLNPAYNFEYPDGRFRYSDFSEQGGLMYQHWLLPLAKSADLILHATDSIFDCAAGRLPHNHAYVGPLFWEEPGESMQHLDKTGPPWILITLSTSPQLGDLAIVTAALQALKNLEVRVLVTLAPEHDLELLGDIPANVYLTRYTPHSRVLSQCLLVISHAGHGTVMKAMVHGIPMVLVPWGRDQPGVASRAQRLGVATVVSRNDCNEQTLFKAIKQVMGEQQFQENSQSLSKRLGNSDAPAIAMGHLRSFLENT